MLNRISGSRRFDWIARKSSNSAKPPASVSAEGAISAAPTPTSGDLHAGRIGQPGGQRAAGEHDPAGREEALGAEQVRQPPAQEEETAERDDIGVEDPGEILRGEA